VWATRAFEDRLSIFLNLQTTYTILIPGYARDLLVVVIHEALLFRVAHSSALHMRSFKFCRNQRMNVLRSVLHVQHSTNHITENEK